MHKVLVVDDEEPILELLKYNLEKGGYEVKTASDGSKAVDIAKKFVPDLVLLDIMMPKMDGVETCRLLRDIPELQKTFVVFLTARSEEYSEVAAFDVRGRRLHNQAHQAPRFDEPPKRAFPPRFEKIVAVKSYYHRRSDHRPYQLYHQGRYTRDKPAQEGIRAAVFPGAEPQQGF